LKCSKNETRIRRDIYNLSTQLATAGYSRK